MLDRTVSARKKCWRRGERGRACVLGRRWGGRGGLLSRRLAAQDQLALWL